jgi:hypothetical protein
MSEEKTIHPIFLAASDYLSRAGFHNQETYFDTGHGRSVYVIRLLLEQGDNLEESRQRAAQCLLNAGYLGFRSKIETIADHYVNAPGEHTPRHYEVSVNIVFHAHVQYGSEVYIRPEPVEPEIHDQDPWVDYDADPFFPDDENDELESLDQGLRKDGLID